MKILMTGSTGLVGSRLVELLAPQHEIVELCEEDGFDVTDRRCVRWALDTDAGAVVHLAAFTDVGAAWRQNGQTDGSCYQVNAVGTRNIARVCAEYGLYLIHFSTDFVFAGQERSLYFEGNLPRPIEWYGKTKLLAEAEVVASECEYSILRIAYPFRAYFPGKLDLVRWILKGLGEGNLPPMVSDQWITPTFIDDLASVVGYFVTQQPRGIYHAVGSTVTTPYLLARRIATSWGFDPDMVRKSRLDDLLRLDPRPRQQYLGLSNWNLRRLGLQMSDLGIALRTVKAQMREN